MEYNNVATDRFYGLPLMSVEDCIRRDQEEYATCMERPMWDVSPAGEIVEGQAFLALVVSK